MNNKATGLFRSIKTAHNKSRGRRGSLLILVLVMLVVAMILITSALTITAAARNRYYTTSLSSQAGLTATSVAKTIGAAAKNGQLTSADLDALVGLSTNPIVVTGVSNGTLTMVPGLAGVMDSTGNTKTSYTDAMFEHSNAAHTNYKITVTTHLDAGSATEQSDSTVYVYLTPNVVTVPDGFGAAVAISGSGQLPSFNVLSTPTAKSNFVILTGDTLSRPNGQSVYSGDLIITGHVSIGNSFTVNGNLVLYGANAGLNGTDNSLGTAMPTISTTSNFLDLRMSANGGTTYYADRDAAFSGAFQPAAILIKDSNMNFARDVLDKLQPSNKKIFTVGTGKVTLNGTEVGSSGTSFTVNKLNTASTAEQTTMNSLITRYTDPNGLVQKALYYMEHSIPKSRTAMNTMLGINVNYGVSITGPALATALQTAGAVPIDVNALTTGQTYTGSSYYIDTSLSPTLMKVLTFNCTANDIDLFIIGTSTLSFGYNNDGAIRFTRSAGSKGIGRIIFLENNAKIDYGYGSGGSIAESGFAGITGAGTPDRYTRTPALITDGSEPYLYIYGYDNNIIVSSIKFLEGYIGLFGTGTVEIKTGKKEMPFYARFNVFRIDDQAGSGTELSYCPAPGEGTTITGSAGDLYTVGYITN